MVEFLGKEFEIRSLPADRFIGVNIKRNRTQKTIHLSQIDYIKKILASFGMTDCSTITVPADPCVKLSPSMCPHTEEENYTNDQCYFLVGGWLPNVPCQSDTTRHLICRWTGFTFFPKPWYGTLEGTEENPGLTAQNNQLWTFIWWWQQQTLCLRRFGICRRSGK
jgi:hypothetical protein